MQNISEDRLSHESHLSNSTLGRLKQTILRRQHEELAVVSKQKQKIIEMMKKLKKVMEEVTELRKNNERLVGEIEGYRKKEGEMEIRIVALKNQYGSQIEKLKCENQLVKQSIREMLRINQSLKNDRANGRSVQQLTAVIERQNNILKMQDRQCSYLQKQNENYERLVQQMKKQLLDLSRYKISSEQHIRQLKANIESLMARIQKQGSEWSMVRSIEMMREKIKEQANTEVQKIEDLVSQF